MVSDSGTGKLYYRDPGQTSFEASIIQVSEDGGRFSVILDRTGFYPEGGGQPSDRGQINGIPVEDVRKSGETIIHILPEHPGQGTVRCQVDMDWRLDFMQQHTGQHIISAALWQTGGYRTVSVHMGLDYTTIEIDTADISREILLEVEILANRIIQQDLPVQVVETTSRELPQYQLRKPCPVEERIRLVKIGDVDCVGCGGLHLDRTGRVGPVKSVGVEKIRGHARITWMIGERALADYRIKDELVRELKLLLATETGMVFKKTLDLKNELDENRKKMNLLTGQLGELMARSLYEQVVPAPATGIRIICHTWKQADDRVIKETIKNLISREKVIACLINLVSEKLFWIIGCSEGVAFDFDRHREKLLAIIEGKGGGRFPLWQGTGFRPENSPLFSREFQERAKTE